MLQIGQYELIIHEFRTSRKLILGAHQKCCETPFCYRHSMFKGPVPDIPTPYYTGMLFITDQYGRIPSCGRHSVWCSRYIKIYNAWCTCHRVDVYLSVMYTNRGVPEVAPTTLIDVGSSAPTSCLSCWKSKISLYHADVIVVIISNAFECVNITLFDWW